MSEKSDEQLKALADLPEKITLADREFSIYPPTPGKIALLMGKIEKFAAIIDEFDKVKAGETSAFTTVTKEAMDEIGRAFAMVTTPNTGKEPVINEETVEFCKWALTPGDIARVLATLAKYSDVGELLKNVLKPRRAASSPGPSSLAGSSSSPAGLSEKLSGESQLEV